MSESTVENPMLNLEAPARAAESRLEKNPTYIGYRKLVQDQLKTPDMATYLNNATSHPIVPHELGPLAETYIYAARKMRADNIPETDTQAFKLTVTALAFEQAEKYQSSLFRENPDKIEKVVAARNKALVELDNLLREQGKQENKP